MRVTGGGGSLVERGVGGKTGKLQAKGLGRACRWVEEATCAWVEEAPCTRGEETGGGEMSSCT